MSRPAIFRHLFVLSAFAIAQPVFDLLARNAEFLSSHAAGTGQVLGLVAVLLLALPVALTLLTLGAERVSTSLARMLGLAFVALLVALATVAPLLRASFLPDGLAVAAAALLGGSAAFAYARSQAIGRLLDWMIIAPPVFATLFLLQSDVRKLWSPAPLPDGAEVESRSLANARTVPIVCVVLDELPLSSLRAADGGVDAGRYPAFAKLAQSATWYRAASGISSTTTLALPALLTGRYPGEERKLPVLADHPDNLFSWLAPLYHLNVVESETLLHPDSQRSSQPGRAHSRQSTLLADTALVYLHTILPQSLGSELPPVSETWGDFWEPNGIATSNRAGQDAMRQAVRLKRKRVGVETDIDAFHRFVESIGTPTGDERPALHFIHVTYPHNPWRMLPSGRRYTPDRKFGYADHRWPSTAWWSIDAYRRHLLQVGHADRLLGALLDELEEAGLFEGALVIVSADHGASFWPGDTFRAARGNSHPEDLLSVPLFVKLPGQMEGQVDDRAVEIIDILPTIAEVLGVAPSWPVDGCSLLRDDCDARQGRRLVRTSAGRHNETLHFDLGVVARQDTLDRKIALFGSDGSDRGLYLAGQWPTLVGRAVTDLPLADASAGEIVLHDAVRTALARSDPALAPARIVGELESSSDAPIVALAIDGVIELVVPAPRDARGVHRVAAMVPERLLPRLSTGLQLYLVKGNSRGDPPTLAPLAIR